MIGDRDRVTLPAGVRLTADGLQDDVRGECFEVNESGRAVLAAADGRRLAAIVSEVAERFGVPAAVARADARAFCGALNERLLLNVEASPGAVALRLLAALSRGLPAGALPAAPRRRRALDTSTVATAFGSAALALARRAPVVGALSALGAAAALAGLGAPQVGPPLALGAAVAAALVVHEGAHAGALRGVPCCLCLAGAAVFLLHPPLARGRRALVAAAGPVAAATAGLAMLAAALALRLDELAPPALVAVSHALALTVAGRDGRAACGLS